MTKHQIKVDEFLKEASQFQLGDLPTESSHPETTSLSQLATTDLKKAINLFQNVEVRALENLLELIPQIEELTQAIKTCFKKKGRVFFCGCGATGRLSISLETNWRESLGKSALADKVLGFIAGGDYALVKSIENFEDHPEYGARQLVELGFTKNDLLVSCTEGGETPFVIGATLKSAEISIYPTYFLFCNPKESLRAIKRSQSVFQNSKIQSWSLPAGPQAICGSTRLQASSILYLACGVALFSSQETSKISVLDQIQNYLSFLKKSDLRSLQNLIVAETKAYVTKEFLTYHLEQDPMPILTDLTERSPTFNLLPLENLVEQSSEPATANLCLDRDTSSLQAWQHILRRRPRALAWIELKNKFSEEAMLGFDFSRSKNSLRQRLIGARLERNIFVEFKNQNVTFTCEDKILCTLSLPNSILDINLFLKLIFNLVSSLSQCQSGRVLGNIMLFVKPSNKKLIDRAARFTKLILKNQYNIESQYEEVIDCVFAASEGLIAEESVVLKSVELFLGRRK